MKVEVGGRSIFVGTGGVEWPDQGPWVVLLHGAGSDHTVWALQARTLAQHGYRVIAPDLPGHGRSTGGPVVDSIDGFVDWLDGLLDALDVAQPVFLAGHSMGSCIALSFAARQGERVAKLALLAAGEEMPVNEGLLEDTLSHPERAHRFIAAFGHGQGAHFGRAANPGTWHIGGTIALLERCDPRVLNADFVASNAWSSEVLPEQVKCPTLVVCGSEDKMTPARTGRALCERFADSRLVEIAGVGHLMMAEAPDDVSRALRVLLTEPCL